MLKREKNVSILATFLDCQSAVQQFSPFKKLSMKEADALNHLRKDGVTQINLKYFLVKIMNKKMHI